MSEEIRLRHRPGVMDRRDRRGSAIAGGVDRDDGVGGVGGGGRHRDEVAQRRHVMRPACQRQRQPDVQNVAVGQHRAIEVVIAGADNSELDRVVAASVGYGIGSGAQTAIDDVALAADGQRIPAAAKRDGIAAIPRRHRLPTTRHIYGVAGAAQVQRARTRRGVDGSVVQRDG